MGIWPQFRSPLIWDVFAVSTYADGLAAVLVRRPGSRPRDAARSRQEPAHQAAVYGMLALGWRGSARHWQRYEAAYLLLAGLSTPLVLSVHTVVSFDFAVGIIPGWHATIFPPYFVAGAIYAGLRDGADARDSAARALRPRRLHHDAAPREHGEGHARHRADRRSTATSWRRSSAGTARNQYEQLHDLQPDDRPVLRRSTGR